jgi:hypothetical protein
MTTTRLELAETIEFVKQAIINNDPPLSTRAAHKRFLDGLRKAESEAAAYLAGVRECIALAEKAAMED